AEQFSHPVAAHGLGRVVRRRRCILGSPSVVERDLDFGARCVRHAGQVDMSMYFHRSGCFVGFHDGCPHSPSLRVSIESREAPKTLHILARAVPTRKLPNRWVPMFPRYTDTYISNLRQRFARIAEAIETDAGLVEQRQVQAAHLAVGPA